MIALHVPQRDFIQAVAGLAQKGWPGVESGEIDFAQIFALIIPIQVVWGVQNVMPGDGIPFALFAHKPEPSWVAETFLPALHSFLLEAKHPLDLNVIGAQMYFGTDALPSSLFGEVLIESELLPRYCAHLRRTVPGIADVAPTWGDASVDSYQGCMWGTGFFFQICSMAQTISSRDNDRALFTDVCKKFISCGAVDIAIAALRSFSLMQDASAAAPPLAGMATILQIAALGEGCASTMLRHLESNGLAAAELHKVLMDAVRRGDALDLYVGLAPLDVRAAMAIGVIFGREEDEAGANTVPSEVATKMVALLLDILNGKSFASAVNIAEVLLAMSASDANTENLLASGVLDAMELVLTQGEDVLDGRQSWLRYNIAAARQACASVLLNLALSQKTHLQVAGHAGIAEGLQGALADEANLTPKSRKLLSDCLFQVQLATDGAATPRTARASPAGKEKQSHVMISYAWAQQELVLRLRTALGERGYPIWIDVSSD